MFGTSLNYAAARLLGLKPLSEAGTRARHWLRVNGGALEAPQWAKLWLAVLGCFSWDGVNPTPPELWMLPNWFPFHPGRMWCHARMVYLPMSVLYGMRYTYVNAENDLTVLALRDELFTTRYDWIDWAATRENISSLDLFSPQSKIMTFGNWLLYRTLENPIIRTAFAWPLHFLREKSVGFAVQYCKQEDLQTNWVDIGPVNKSLNMVAVFAAEGGNSSAFLNHLPRLADYLWVAEDGMKMQGYNGSQLWDTGFAAQGMAAAKLALKEYEPRLTRKEVATNELLLETLVKAYAFFDQTQVRKDEEDAAKWYRHISKGGWPFSTQDHGWPITDCTAEGIKSVLCLHDSRLGVTSMVDQPLVDQNRLADAVNVILSMHNTHKDDGWASYELNRGYNWYEKLNPAQVFGDIMIDYSYVECTSACLQALSKFHKFAPDDPRTAEILTALNKGHRFILAKQKKDGSFYGSWAVCFTYGTWFGVEGLNAALQAGVGDTQVVLQALERAGQFLLSKQLPDGGWGESVEACRISRWVPNDREGAQVVNTAWALLSLLHVADHIGVYPRKTKGEDNHQFRAEIRRAIRHAAHFLRERQLETGDWAQESVSGIFNKSCAIFYTAYRNAFPIWALAKAASWYSLAE